MNNLSDNLNTALLANKIDVAAIVPLAGCLTFFSQSRNAPILKLEALFVTGTGKTYRFSYSAQENMVPSFSCSLLIDYRKAKQVDLVLEDEDGNTLLDTEKKEVLGAVCCQIQNSLDHPKRITTCLAVVEPGRDGLWLASPNSLLEHVGSSYIHQIELALPPEMPEFTATPFPSVPSTMEEEYYEQEQNF